MNVSIICVYNKLEIFQDVLIKSLDHQDYPFEMIGIDNTASQFSSAAKALNYGANRAKGDILVFVHQDVSFEETDSLRRLVETFINNADEGDVGGVVGRGYDRNMQPRIVAGSCANYLGKKVGLEGFQEKYAYAESVDEFLLIMTHYTFTQHPFNEKICNGWHFYAVEQCINAHTKGHDVYVINSDIKHHSLGRTDSNFYWTRLRLAFNYPFYGRVLGTCCDFYTYDFFMLFMKALIRSVMFRIKK